MPNDQLTAERARALFDYEPETGLLRNRERRSSRAPAGAVAGGITPYGYRSVSVDSVRHQAHRVVWLIVHGSWPTADLDHINGVKADNRIANLREASRAENMANRRMSRISKHGAVGVSKVVTGPNYRAQIKAGGRLVHLGVFPTVEEASAAYLAAEASLRGEFSIQLRAETE